MASVDSPVLDRRCSDVLFAKISKDIVNWEELAPYFSLTEAEVQEIRVNHSHQYEVQKHVMLWKWASKQEDKVTNRELRSVFQEAGKSLLVSKVDELLQDEVYLQAPHNVVNSFREYLKDCYCFKPATSQGQEDGEPLLLSQSSFLNPSLVLKSDDSKSLEIEDLCKLGKTVMLEGTAGSGKTTLTRHICQQWAEGKLFPDVGLLIHLTLADPALWSAKSLKDIIPYSSAETIADYIVERRGKGCCFILDGWEDLPEESSFIHKFVDERRLASGGGDDGQEVTMNKLAIPQCLFIVTSRPSATASLQPQVSTTVEITGFSQQNVDTYATQYLTQKGRDPTVFIQALNDNHYARGLCSIPINAAIMLHLFLTIQTGLPTTQTELFKCFILNLLLHRLKDNLPVCCKVQRLHEFSDLPQNEKQVFDNLCLIAHQCTFNGKASLCSNQLLSSDDLCEAELNDTLGLMKVHQPLTWFGYVSHYGFLHSSIQDFLCAVRMTQLSPEEQVRDFSLLLNTNPTSLVLRFYAGLTKLWNKYVRELLCDIGREPPGYDCIRQLHATHSAGSDPRRRFLTYLHCLYEANMTNVLVKLDVNSPHETGYLVLINFFHYRLTIYDISAISYYILSIARISHPFRTALCFFVCLHLISVQKYDVFILILNFYVEGRSVVRLCVCVYSFKGASCHTF